MTLQQLLETSNKENDSVKKMRNAKVGNTIV